MTALVLTRGLVDSIAELFDPIDVAPIERLLEEHAAERRLIEHVAATFTDPKTLAVLSYYLRGNEVQDSYTAERMFQTEAVAKAMRALDASYWGRALDATDVLSSMPAKRREEWHEQIRKFDVPPFAEDTIRSTLAEHIASRHRYFAERVDGLFRALSPDHKTNIAAGFRSKMILQHITNDWYAATSRADYLTDLRVVVARFMGRSIGDDYTVHMLTRKAIEEARRHARGEWVTLDGGAIEILIATRV